MMVCVTHPELNGHQTLVLFLQPPAQRLISHSQEMSGVNVGASERWTQVCEESTPPDPHPPLGEDLIFRSSIWPFPAHLHTLPTVCLFALFETFACSPFRLTDVVSFEWSSCCGPLWWVKLNMTLVEATKSTSLKMRPTLTYKHLQSVWDWISMNYS